MFKFLFIYIKKYYLVFHESLLIIITLFLIKNIFYGLNVYIKATVF